MAKPLPWVKFEELDEHGGKFIVSPLTKGMGTTLGNSLRRVLLSSLSGSAITAVKIEGVQHEFSTIPNVVEDVLDVIGNLKAIVFKNHSEEKQILKIDFKGKGKVKAKDIQCSSEVEVVNPDCHIAEVADGGRLKMELVLQNGTGYSVSEAHKTDDQDIHTINLDASFSPIVRVNHQVEPIRVGKELDFDSLVMDVYTNGSVDAEVAVQEAAKLLISKFELFLKLNHKPEQVASDHDSKVDKKQSALALSIDDLELSARSSNCLKRAGIVSVAELIEKDMSELIQIKNFGKKSADEINDKLRQFGLALKGVATAN